MVEEGWSRAYGFNVGDLKICADVLESYLTRSLTEGTGVPWADLRYLFGEIMYGGHITDFFDRRTNNTYLTVIMNEALLNKGDLAPKLKSPDAGTWNYDDYTNFITKLLPPESPSIYGLHPNAEIGFITNKAENLCTTVLSLEMGSTVASSAAGSSQGYTRDMLVDLLARCPAAFDMITFTDRCQQRILDPDGPYVVCVLQECTRLNALLSEMVFTLDELQKGLNGQLNMSQGMEDMTECLSLNQVPGRNPFHACNWERLAWASRKSLSSWFADLLLRRDQLDAWSSSLMLPFSLWLPGLINPTAMLTAIKQVPFFFAYLHVIGAYLVFLVIVCIGHCSKKRSST